MVLTVGCWLLAIGYWHKEKVAAETSKLLNN